MHAFIAAALALCSTGNAGIATKIATEASAQEADVVMSLAIGLMESGYQSGNPMGVRGCYPKAKVQTGRDDAACIRIGVRSLNNRLRYVRASMPSKDDLLHCSRSGNMRMCRALANYNSSPRKYIYAKKGMALVRKIYKLSGVPWPNT